MQCQVNFRKDVFSFFEGFHHGILRGIEFQIKNAVVQFEVLQTGFSFQGSAEEINTAPVGRQGDLCIDIVFNVCPECCEGLVSFAEDEAVDIRTGGSIDGIGCECQCAGSNRPCCGVGFRGTGQLVPHAVVDSAAAFFIGDIIVKGEESPFADAHSFQDHKVSCIDLTGFFHHVGVDFREVEEVVTAFSSGDKFLVTDHFAGIFEPPEQLSGFRTIHCQTFCNGHFAEIKTAGQAVNILLNLGPDLLSDGMSVHKTAAAADHHGGIFQLDRFIKCFVNADEVGNFPFGAVMCVVDFIAETPVADFSVCGFVEQVKEVFPSLEICFIVGVDVLRQLGIDFIPHIKRLLLVVLCGILGRVEDVIGFETIFFAHCKPLFQTLHFFGVERCGA